MKRFAAAVGVALLLTSTSLTPVLAQDTVTTIDVQATNELLATDLIGHPLYNADDEAVGAVNNLIFSVDGQLTGVVVGVGGFLGIGTKNVAIPLEALTLTLDENGAIRATANITREQLDAAEAYQNLTDQGLTVELETEAPAAEPAPATPEPAPAATPEPATPAPAATPEPATPAPAATPEPAAPAPAEPATPPAATPEPAPAPATPEPATPPPATPAPAEPAPTPATPAPAEPATPAPATPAPAEPAPATPTPAAPAPAPAEPAAPAPAAAAATVDPAVMAAGQPLYQRNCQACHGDQGQGGAGERLVGSPIVRTVGGIINQILVGSVEHGMPPFNRLSNDEIAAIATYVRNSWGNDFGPITPEQVQQSRGAAAE